MFSRSQLSKSVLFALLGLLFTLLDNVVLQNWIQHPDVHWFRHHVYLDDQ